MVIIRRFDVHVESNVGDYEEHHRGYDYGVRHKKGKGCWSLVLL